MILIILLALSVVGTYLVYCDAQARGMRARSWAFVMIVTSLLALPLYLLVRRPKLSA